MKAIKEIKEVEIYRFGGGYFWRVNNSKRYGVFYLQSPHSFTRKEYAINNFEKFAQLNEIKNYKII